MRLFIKLNLFDWMGLVSAIGDKKCVKAFLASAKYPNPNKTNTFYYGQKALEDVSNIVEFVKWICQKNSGQEVNFEP